MNKEQLVQEIKDLVDDIRHYLSIDNISKAKIAIEALKILVNIPR